MNMYTKKWALVIVCLLLVTALLIPGRIQAAGAPVLVGGQSFATIEEAVLAAQVGDTLLLTGDISIDAPLTIPGDKQLILDLAGFTVTSNIDLANRFMFNVSGNGAFSMTNGQLTAADLNSDGKSGAALNVSSATLSIHGVEMSGFHSTQEGAAIYSHSANVTITDSYFHDNSAASYGGALSLRPAVVPGSTGVNISGSTIENNLITGPNYAHGGGISFVGSGTFIMSNNTVANNEARVSSLTHGFYWSHGGGISVSGQMSSGNIAFITLQNNLITANRAQLYGGGIYFMLNGSDQLNLASGVFENNVSEFAGGAIDYSVHGQPTLHLENALITGNQAITGAGIWACPTSKIETYSTLGGAIVRNNLLDRYNTRASGTDIRFEGSDTIFTNYLDNNNPAYHQVTVTHRTYNGDLMDWYADEMNDLYEAGDSIVAPEYYTARSTTFGLYGELNDQAYERLAGEAKLIFRNNVAGFRGGAISTNSDITIGEALDMELKVSKQWVDENDNPLTEGIADSVDIQLWRVDENGTEILLETIGLSPVNQWSHTFTALPTKGWVDGTILNFDYKAVESTSLTGFSTEYTTSNIDAGHREQLIKNKRNPLPKTGDLKVSKNIQAPEGSEALNQMFNFTVSLSDTSINGDYGEMHFINGVASFSLVNAASKTASGLPVGLTYTVAETEANQNGFTTSAENANGTITEAVISEVLFVNSYTPQESSSETTSSESATSTETTASSETTTSTEATSVTESTATSEATTVTESTSVTEASTTSETTSASEGTTLSETTTATEATTASESTTATETPTTTDATTSSKTTTTSVSTTASQTTTHTEPSTSTHETTTSSLTTSSVTTMLGSISTTTGQNPPAIATPGITSTTATKFPRSGERDAHAPWLALLSLLTGLFLIGLFAHRNKKSEKD